MVQNERNVNDITPITTYYLKKTIGSNLPLHGNCEL